VVTISQLRVLCVDDEPLLLNAFRRLLEADTSHRISTAEGKEAALASLDPAPDLIFLDYMMPGVRGLDLLREVCERCPETEVVMLTSHNDAPTAVEAIRIGAFDYLVKPPNREQLRGVFERVGRVQALRRENAELKSRLSQGVSAVTLIGDSRAMADLRNLVVKAAQSGRNVLITGAHGTGKELVARTLHFAGPRAREPFVPVECSSVSEQLFESELFGHVRGAFTGAEKNREGLCKAAGKGTLFLDEIAEIPLASQAKLLRVLQEREYRPVGSNDYRPLKARIVAATNVDLKAAMEKGALREDLFYRLNVIRIDLPLLRGRKGDVPVLVRHFLSTLAEPSDRPHSISAEALRCLENYAWPGNVRELRNCVERILALCDSEVVAPADLPVAIRAGRPEVVMVSDGRGDAATDEEVPAYPREATVEQSEEDPPHDLVTGGALTLQELERVAIRRAVKRTRGNVPAASAQLGVSASTIYRKLKTYGIDVRDLQDVEESGLATDVAEVAPAPPV
jgi:DNA-binding NtrC family response regulator